jgi:hypothetical protein
VNSSIPDIVEPHEPLARFLTHRTQFSRQNNRVKTVAFMPPADMRLSVFRVHGLGSEKIWEIGEEIVVHQTAKTLYGRAEIKALEVSKNGLYVDPDNIPPRHANILGWPQEKSKQKAIAIELAENATLALR